ncbi:glutamate receptor ionotropic, kainate 2-like [Oppia nitens]|uniref:glutamate receptor ionotropic, kainate 2-like n=1 Tax=Oppia nitens TaxID=1686743 RepID=UPI0023DAEB3C|nr:glutamate receptor ionotropic, kainate 2-like [Oppia nitens]
MLIFIIQLIVHQFITCVTPLPPIIRIGGLFGANDTEQELAFHLAIDRINSDRNILQSSTLVPEIQRITDGDSFHTNKKVCSLLANGAIALFGPLGGQTALHVQSICDALEIPHIECHSNSRDMMSDHISINLYPKPSSLSRAYVDLVKAWGWKVFAIVYEDNHGIVRIQDFLKEAQQYDWTIKLYQFSDRPYRDIFWEIKMTKVFHVIIDVNRLNIFTVLKHAQQVGMMTEFQSYLITSLDLQTINLEDFKFAKTKITSFRLVDSTNPELYSLMTDWTQLASKRGLNNASKPTNLLTESALLYDSVKLLATALQDLDQSQSITMPSISCQSDNQWQFGTSLMNYMRPITFRGLTGLVDFDQFGHRSSFTLDVMTISDDGLQKIGYWSGSQTLQPLNISDEWRDNFSYMSLANQTLIVTTIINPPYCMLRESSKTKYGNDRFEGYIVDLIDELSKLLGFKYKFKTVDDNKYGAKNETGFWNGLIGEVLNGKADIAVVDLTITSKRAEAVDFTLPFMNTGISILFKKPTTKVTTLFSFLSPFSNIVWVYVLAAYVGVSSVLFIVGRLSPYEWDNPHPCRNEDFVLENNFSLTNSFFFTIGSLMQQGSDLTPKAMSTRAIAAIWYFFTLIMISSYTANLAAFLTVEKVISPIESAADLASQSSIEYGCLASGSTRAFFQESNISTFKKMWEFMKNRDVFVDSNDIGKQRVEKGNYAYLMESASIEYSVERDCNLTQVGGLLDTKGYGIATRKNSKYRGLLSQSILKLQETGRLLMLKEKWWKQKKGGGKCTDDNKKSSSVTALKIDNVGGVFVVLLGGLSLAFFVAICEFMWRSRKSTAGCETMCEEMINDLKFSFACQSKSKPGKRKSYEDNVNNSSYNTLSQPQVIRGQFTNKLDY